MVRLTDLTKKKKIILLFAGLIFLCGTAGCGKNRNVETDKDRANALYEEYTPDGINHAADESVSDSQEAMTWNEMIDAKLQNASGIQINATLRDDIRQAGIVYAYEPEFTREYMEEFCNSAMEDAVCHITPDACANNGEVITFTGTILDVLYTVNFLDGWHADTDIEREWIKENGEGSVSHRKCIYWIAENAEAVTCSGTEQDAVTAADKVISGLSVPYMHFDSVEKINIDTEFGKTAAYRVCYIPYMDGMPLNYERDENKFNRLNSFNICAEYSANISLEVFVADGGAFCIRYNNPVVFSEITEPKPLISFAEAQAALTDNLKLHADEILCTAEDGYVLFDEVRMQYVRIRENGSFCYVPAYVLCRLDRESNQYENFIAVDARDGSYIDVVYQLFGDKIIL